LWRSKNNAQRLADVLSLGALLTTAVYLLFPALVNWATVPLPLWLRGMGGGVALAGFALLQWAHHTLRRNWSAAWIRHPMYTAFLLILAAPFFLSANVLLGSLWILGAFIEIRSRIAFEENLLAQTFGAE
jgi:protein-S-isoprenylcysteine O-methyltransferase Ste14